MYLIKHSYITYIMWQKNYCFCIKDSEMERCAPKVDSEILVPFESATHKL